MRSFIALASLFVMGLVMFVAVQREFAAQCLVIGWYLGILTGFLARATLGLRR